MAEQNIGKITQIIGAVLDIKFSQGRLPSINDARPWDVSLTYWVIPSIINQSRK